MSSLRANYSYCAFLDVLGYGKIVSSPLLSTQRKLDILNEVYKNLFSSLSSPIRQMSKGTRRSLFIKSFSDNVFLQSPKADIILYILYSLFYKAFGYGLHLET